MTAQIEFRALGCRIKAMLDAPAAKWRPGAPTPEDRLAQVPGWFEAWEDCLSRFRTESELSRLNRSAGEWVQVSPTLWRVLQAARQAERRSGGLVTPVVLDALEAAGYTHSFAELPRHQAQPARSAQPSTGLTGLELDADTRRVRLPAGVRLDFGGVAKGWAAHQAMRRLAAFGPALVDAGGDIAISAVQRSGDPWRIRIDDPLQLRDHLGLVRLGRGAVATSGQDYRRWTQGGVQKHHIIDPRTGQPADTDVLTATVVAPTILAAEMAAKVVFILGSQMGLAWLETQPQMSGLVVTLTGSVVIGRGLERLHGQSGAPVRAGL